MNKRHSVFLFFYFYKHLTYTRKWQRNIIAPTELPRRKSFGRAQQIPNAVRWSEYRNIGFSVTVIICRRRFIIGKTESNRVKRIIAAVDTIPITV